MPTILLIDDNEDFRQTLTELLERAGYDVVEAADGRKGIELFRAKPTDLVVTDIIMPEQDGLEVITVLRSDYPDVKIITISGGGRLCTDPELFLDASTSMGALHSFTKPLDRLAFLAVVREVLPLD